MECRCQLGWNKDIFVTPVIEASAVALACWSVALGWIAWHLPVLYTSWRTVVLHFPRAQSWLVAITHFGLLLASTFKGCSLCLQLATDAPHKHVGLCAMRHSSLGLASGMLNDLGTASWLLILNSIALFFVATFFVNKEARKLHHSLTGVSQPVRYSTKITKPWLYIPCRVAAVALNLLVLACMVVKAPLCVASPEGHDIMSLVLALLVFGHVSLLLIGIGCLVSSGAERSRLRNSILLVISAAVISCAIGVAHLLRYIELQSPLASSPVWDMVLRCTIAFLELLLMACIFSRLRPAVANNRFDSVSSLRMSLRGSSVNSPQRRSYDSPEPITLAVTGLRGHAHNRSDSLDLESHSSNSPEDPKSQRRFRTKTLPRERSSQLRYTTRSRLHSSPPTVQQQDVQWQEQPQDEEGVQTNTTASDISKTSSHSRPASTDPVVVIEQPQQHLQLPIIEALVERISDR